MYKLIYFVPESHLEATKNAIFAAGAGRQGNYEHCCFQLKGVGQFKPVAGAQPHIGQLDELTTLPEWRVEALVVQSELSHVLAALRTAHPYEEPAMEVVQLVELTGK